MPQPAPRFALARILSFLDSEYACKGLPLGLAVAAGAAADRPLPWDGAMPSTTLHESR